MPDLDLSHLLVVIVPLNGVDITRLSHFHNIHPIRATGFLLTAR